ncbi:MAG: hypothetical protein GXP50_11330 [Deltaproteobacteria bacterium]|nr:hypothetical protein [Deltaproteobacteria bacterium]
MSAVLGLDTSERTAGAAVVVDGAVRYEAVEASAPASPGGSWPWWRRPWQGRGWAEATWTRWP